jgi:hypothetical protein
VIALLEVHETTQIIFGLCLLLMTFGNDQGKGNYIFFEEVNKMSNFSSLQEKNEGCLPTLDKE